MRDQIAVNMRSQSIKLGPGFIRERQSDARFFANAIDLHVKCKFTLRGLDKAGNRCSRAIMWCRCQRQMAFTTHQARCRIKADPPRTRNINLGPCMKIGEIMIRAFGAIYRINIGFQLDEIARDKAGGEAKAAREMHQQPCRVTAGA